MFLIMDGSHATVGIVTVSSLKASLTPSMYISVHARPLVGVAVVLVPHLFTMYLTVRLPNHMCISLLPSQIVLLPHYLPLFKTLHLAPQLC